MMMSFFGLSLILFSPFDVSSLFQVVNTVNHLLELLEDGGMILIQRSSPHPTNYSDQPKSTRDKVVSELLETERKYVHDLEKLQVIQQGMVVVCVRVCVCI